MPKPNHVLNAAAGFRVGFVLHTLGPPRLIPSGTTSHLVMKFVTYTATPELNRFPERDRFSVWRATHKRLMRTDPEYQRRVRGFHWRIVGTSVLYAALSQALGRLTWPPFVLELPASLVLTAIYAIYILRASLSMQHFQNKKVGNALHEAMF